MTDFDTIWRAITREASSAAEHMAIGATAIGRARHDRVSVYAQAFFALSVGFERSAKLAVAIDHALDGGEFPTRAQLRGYGHNLRRLLQAVEEIHGRRALALRHGGLPETSVHLAIVDVLTSFATNVTRYYNLEVLGADSGSARDDPIASWYSDVTLPVLDLHYSKQRAERDGLRAAFAAEVLGSVSVVRGVAETGESINTVAEATLRSLQAEAARPWERMYVMQIARFLGATLVKLADLAHETKLPVPFLEEFFFIFAQDDAYFRSRKTWSLEAAR
jgi:hypothetical protein